MHPGHAALVVVVVLQALGFVLSTLQEGTPVGAWLFLERGWSEPAAQLLEWAGTMLAFSAAFFAAFARRPLFRSIGAALASFWALALSCAEWWMGGVPFADLAVLAHAARVGAPLLLALEARPSAFLRVLRWSVASTFAVHGFEALQLHPGFVDFLLAADRNHFGLGLRQAGAESLLRVIGVVDLALATYVLLRPRPHRGILAWMAAWGAVSAASRVVQGGEGALHLALVRVANGGLPFVWLLHSSRTSMVVSPLRRPAHATLHVLPFLFLLFACSKPAPVGEADHLRLVWTEDPAHRALVAWSAPDAGGMHAVHYDVVPRGGDPGAYARVQEPQRSGAYVTGGGYFHHATLEDLEPSTTYYFVVQSDGQVSEERHFVTAPADDRPFRILSGGDSRPPGEAVRRSLNEIIARLAQDDPTILAFAHGGDYIRHAEEWEEWQEWLDDHEEIVTEEGRLLPIIPLRGNHEADGEMYNQVFGFPGGDEVDYFATRLGKHAVLLNLDTNSSLAGDQLVWLERQLEQAQAGRWIVPTYHRPAYPAVKTPGSARQFWVPLFERYEVDVACESDGHALKRTVPIREDREDPSGIVYVGEGGLGVPQREPEDRWYLRAPGMATTAHHVQLFSFSPTELRYEAIGIDGDLLDSQVFLPKRHPAAD